MCVDEQPVQGVTPFCVIQTLLSLFPVMQWLSGSKSTCPPVQRTTRDHSQFEDGRALPQHHPDEVAVVDGVAAAPRHLHDHLLHVQVRLGNAQLLHHLLQTHDV